MQNSSISISSPKNKDTNYNKKREEFYKKLSESPDRNKKCQKIYTTITKNNYNEYINK